MKTMLLFTLFIFASCTQGLQFRKMSHEEITDYVMKESLLDGALKSAALSAPNCLRPFEPNMSRPLYDKLLTTVRHQFRFEDVHASIRKKMMAGSDRSEMYSLAKDLHGKIWQKFLIGIQKSSMQTQKHSKIFQALEEGSFDLTTPRSNLVARITDQAYMVNLVRLSNDQVLTMISFETKFPLNTKQQDILKWVAGELKLLNEAHIRALFTTTYIATEEFSESELTQLLAIRSNDVIKSGKIGLEEELASRYRSFYLKMKKIIGKSN